MNHCKNQRGLGFSGQTENEEVASQLRNISIALLFTPLTTRAARILASVGSCASREDVGP